METFIQDLRYGMRILLKNPGFTLTTVLVLALGIGANTAIFSVVDGILFRPLPYREPDRLVFIHLTSAAQGSTKIPLSVADFLDLRSQNQSFENLAAYTNNTFNFTGGPVAEQFSGALVTAGFFSTLGVKPMLGRIFSPDEDKPGTELVTVISHSLWQRRFDSDRAIDKDIPLADIRTMEQLMSESIAQPRLRTVLLSLFAVLALALAAVGLYGVISYSVSHRTHEIGIRLALGARPNDVLRMVVGQGMILVLTGLMAGLLGAFALARLLSDLVYGVTVTDPITFLIVSILLCAVALMACFIPARRATKVDPMVALRYE